jgi:lincosamide nucleotidyltransferase A/C/D/E
MMLAEDAVSIYRFLAAAGIRVWLTGGWGIDALLGEQTRSHKDLDIIMLVDDVVRMCALLERRGYRLKEIWSENRYLLDGHGDEIATAFVLHDPTGREIDVHAMWLDAQGNGLPAWDSEGFIFRSQNLAGAGSIAGRPVPCLTPEIQLALHTGYALPVEQTHDIERLRARFGGASSAQGLRDGASADR